MATFVFSACGGDDAVPNAVESITIVKSDLIFEPAGRTGSVEVLAKGPVTVELQSDWCSASVNGNVVSVTVADNNSFEGRTALMTLRADGAARRLPIQQRGMALGSLPVNSHHSPNSGERFALYIRHDLPVTLTCDDDWIHPEMMGDSLVITIEKNPNLYLRRSVVGFECAGYEDELTITQYDFEYILGTYFMAGTGQGGVTQGFRFNFRKVDNDYFINFFTVDQWADRNVPVEFDEGLCEITFHSATNIYEKGTDRDIIYFFQEDGTVANTPGATMKALIYYNPFQQTHYAALEDGGTWGGDPLVGLLIYTIRGGGMVQTALAQLLDPYLLWLGSEENIR